MGSERRRIVDSALSAVASELVEVSEQIASLSKRRDALRGKLLGAATKEFGSSLTDSSIEVPTTSGRYPVLSWRRDFDPEIAATVLTEQQKASVSETVLSAKKAREVLGSEDFSKCLKEPTLMVSLSKAVKK